MIRDGRNEGGRPDEGRMRRIWEVLGPVVIAAATVGITILWDYVGKRTELILVRKQAATILQKHGEIEKLQITYDGNPVEALSKTVLVLRNSGSTAIPREDVKSPVQITFDGDLLDASLVRQTPRNLGASVSRTDRRVTIDFTLLNAGDEVEVGVLSSGAVPEYAAEALIKNVRLAVIGAERQLSVREDLSVGIYVVALLSIVCVFALFFFAPDAMRKWISMRGLMRALAGRRSASGREQAKMVDEGLPFLAQQDRNEIVSRIAAHGPSISTAALHDIKRLIWRKTEWFQVVVWTVASFTLAFIGVAYVLNVVFL